MSDRLAIHASSLIRRAAALHPEREAIVFGERRIAYADLALATDRLAALLGDAGLAPGDRVALLGRNSVDYALAMLALARHGFVALPLNWRLSDEALAGTAGKFESGALLYTEEFAEQADTLAGAVGTIELSHSLDGAPLPSEARAREWAAREARKPRREDLFACISTGGTEGCRRGSRSPTRWSRPV